MMAFKTPPAGTIAWAESEIPRGVRYLAKQHEAAVAKLLDAANAANGSMNTAVTLAAIKEYREAMQGTEEKPGPRDTIRQLARFLIAAGLPPGQVCRGLGFGRTWLNKYMRAEPSFSQLIEPGCKSVREVV